MSGLNFECFPNELFLHGIFNYLSFNQINYGFLMLNDRFNTLVRTYLSKSIHHIDIRQETTGQELLFVIDNLLPNLSENHRLKRIESNHSKLFVRFVDNIARINTTYLSELLITCYIDIDFDMLMNLVDQCPQLNEMKLKLLTNVDPSLANGRKWIRWFDRMLEKNRQEIFQIIEICVWCVDTTRSIHFNSKHWNFEGSYRSNHNWKVQLKSAEHIEWKKSRQLVEFSRTDHNNLTLSSNTPNTTCILS